MIFRGITLLIALVLAANVAYASVFGFMAIFAAAPYFALSMGVTIEVAKLVGISYLYRHWSEMARTFRYSLLSVTLMTILLSAIGVFGFLSRAHLENSNPVENNSARIEYLDEQIKTNQAAISSANSELSTMQAEIDKLIEFDKVSGPTGSKATKEAQMPRRNELNTIISDSNDKIFDLRNEKLTLEKEVNSYSVEIGPIRYVAEMFWDVNDENNIDKAVRLLIILIMFVFDPFAILLLMAYNHNKIKSTKQNIDKSVVEEIEPENKPSESEVTPEPIEVELPEMEDVDVQEEVKEDTTSEEVNNNGKAIEKLAEVVGELNQNFKDQLDEKQKRKDLVEEIRQG